MILFLLVKCMTSTFETCWNELFVHAGAKRSGTWLFRGQRRSEWPLVPSIGRPPVWGKGRYSKAQEVELFRQFQRDVLRHRGFERFTDFEHLAIGQHYGLPSRLLDWTTNILTAAFFACQPEPDGSEVDGAIVMLSVPSSRIEPFWADPFDAQRRREPFFVRVLPFDQRMYHQDGLFSLHPDPRKPWDVSKSGFVHDRFEIPGHVKRDMRLGLEQLSFSNARLLRDLDKACADLAATIRKM